MREASTGPGGLAFVFAGQGPQWWAMGRELLGHDPLFRTTIERCDAAVLALGGDSLLEALMASEEDSRLSDPWCAQPALVALQIALSERLRSWGIEPSAIVGHSLGELAAAHAAEALTVEQAMEVAWQRVQMQDGTEDGAMAVARLTPAEADALVAPFGERLSVGAYNGPKDVMLSGEAVALDEALERLRTRRVAHKRLPARDAFHSARMDGACHRLDAALRDLRPAAPRVALYSSVRGHRARPGDFDGPYQARNVREPVRFAPAITAMVEAGIRTFIEISPHPSLVSSIHGMLETAGVEGLVLATLDRKKPERVALQQTRAALRSAGYEPEDAEVQTPRVRVSRWSLRLRKPSRHPGCPCSPADPASVSGPRVVVSATRFR